MDSNGSVKKRFVDGANASTMHGVPNVARATSVWRRLFWSAVCITGICLFCLHSAKMISKYYQYQTKTVVSMKIAEPMKFPAVTLCNLNAVRKSKRSLLHSSKSNSSVSGPRLSNRMADLEMFYMRYASLSGEKKKEMGHKLENGMLRSCEFNGFRCNASSFAYSHNPEYGNCYTFNAAANNANPKYADHTGPMYGLTLELFIEQDDEYTQMTTEAAGLMIAVHNQSTMPFPDEDGYRVSPGRITSLALSMVEISKLAAPYGNCKKNTIGDNMRSNMFYTEKNLDIGYSDKACSKTCLQRATISKCGCRRSDLRCEHSKVPVCNITDPSKGKCVNLIVELYNNGSMDCLQQCPETCRIINYKVDVSSSYWPSSAFVDAVLNNFNTTNNSTIFPNLTETEQEAFIRNNLLKVQVYFKTFNYENIETESAYSSADLMSDIGGQMGLWLGFSVITLFELIELIADLCAIIIRKLHKGPEIKPSESKDTTDAEKQKI